MGKGDKKSRRGKIFAGSFGKTRPKKKNNKSGNKENKSESKENAEQITGFVTSVHGVAIRLTDERWAHITEENSELAGMRFEVLETLAQPTRIYEGGDGEKLAVREVETDKFLVAVYRESKTDGFIITAFLTRRIKSLEKRNLLWSPLK